MTCRPLPLGHLSTDMSLNFGRILYSFSAEHAHQVCHANWTQQQQFIHYSVKLNTAVLCPVIKYGKQISSCSMTRRGAEWRNLHYICILCYVANIVQRDKRDVVTACTVHALCGVPHRETQVVMQVFIRTNYKCNHVKSVWNLLVQVEESNPDEFSPATLSVPLFDSAAAISCVQLWSAWRPTVPAAPPFHLRLTNSLQLNISDYC